MRTNRTATLADEVGIINWRNHYENLRKQAMPDCRKCKATLEANGVEFEFIDITEGLLNLK